MFTGIISEVGVVTGFDLRSELHRISVQAPNTVLDASVGDSVAVNGVCLTVTHLVDGGFRCEAVDETMDRTALGELATGSRVNLERPMAASGRFDGHVVQGHVDGVGIVETVAAEHDARRLRLRIPDQLARYIVEKGSVALDGVSLTLTAVSPSGESAWLEVVLIPHTLENTTLGQRTVGDRINVEVDVFAKYIERMTEMSS